MNSLNCGFQFGRLESERAGFALICDSALRVDEVQTVWPPGIGAFCHVTEIIDHSRQLDAQAIDAGPGEGDTLGIISRACKDEFFFDIVFRLPDIARMGFQDVDDQERNTIAILLVKAVQGGNLPPERRSCVAAEDQYDGLLGSECAQLDTSAFVELGKIEVWS